MFKLVVLSALVAFVAAKPSGIIGASLYAAPAVALPAAVSHQYRSDVISKPAVIATYAAAPVVEAYAAPALVAAPVVHNVVPYSAAITHESRVDYHSAPLIAAAPVYAGAYAGAHVLPAVHAY